MLVQLLAAAALAFFLWSLFRFAIGLRSAKLAREQARRAEEARGRRVAAELPLEDGVVLFLEDTEGVHWSGQDVRRTDLIGARALLNGAVASAFAIEGATLPPPPQAEEFEGRERWDVALYLRDGGVRLVPCGTVREGVSREAAARVFEAVRAAVGKDSHGDTEARRTE